MDGFIKPELLNLPWATLLTLASGYAGYYVAHLGVREHHKPIDVTFNTLVFGFLAAFVYAYCRRQSDDILAASAVAFVSAVFLGGCWSKWGRDAFEGLLRRAGVSFSDDLPSAWSALFRSKAVGRQLSVKLRDGTWLRCEDVHVFAKQPNGPCVFGTKGDLLMYVTHWQGPGETEFAPCGSVIDSEWGAEITYLPADQIARIDYRRSV